MSGLNLATGGMVANARGLALVVHGMLDVQGAAAVSTTTRLTRSLRRLAKIVRRNITGTYTVTRPPVPTYDDRGRLVDTTSVAAGSGGAAIGLVTGGAGVPFGVSLASRGWVGGATSTVEIDDPTLQVPAFVQPADGGKVADFLPEGTIVYEAIDIWTTTKLIPGPPDGGGDVITVDGNDFWIVRVEPFDRLGGFYHAYAIR